MGGFFSRIGSDPYYANYERSLEQLKTEAERLKGLKGARDKKKAVIGRLVILYGTALFFPIVLYAAYVLRRPPGTYSMVEHIKRVSPVFLEPLLAWVAYHSVEYIMSWRDKADAAKLVSLDHKLRKMLSELKDSTRYKKTHALLKKYDPDYVPTPQRYAGPPPAFRGANSDSGGETASTPIVRRMTADDSGFMSPRGMQGAIHRGVQGAGHQLLPMFDRLANSLIGDNPVLTEALRAARAEVEALRQRVTVAEARAERLQALNREQAERLGEEPPQSVASEEDLAEAAEAEAARATASEAASGGSFSDAFSGSQIPAGLKEPSAQRERKPAGDPAEPKQKPPLAVSKEAKKDK